MTAEELVNAIQEETEKQRRAKQAEIAQTKQRIDGQFTTSVNKFTDVAKEPERVTAKIAKTFNTNQAYVSDAQRLKTTAPEKFQQVLSGEKGTTETNIAERRPRRSRLSIKSCNKSD